MSHGIKFVMPDGRIYDSSSIPISFVEVVPIAGGSSGSKAYPLLAGFTMNCSSMKTSTDSRQNLSDFVFTYDLGHPVLTWFPTRTGLAGTTQLLFVFAR